MGYIVYHINGRRSIKWYGTERGAKIGKAAMNRNAGYEAYGYLEESEFNAQFNGWVKVKNLMSGKEVSIREQDVGTCCDPSTETYWSM